MNVAHEDLILSESSVDERLIREHDVFTEDQPGILASLVVVGAVGEHCVTEQDGDLMFGPGVLWTAAHHEIPLLNVMHNNRAYHAERMIVQRVANSRNRGVDSSSLIGNSIDNPAIDFAKLAEGLGLWSAGTITDPRDLHAALTRAVDVVENGEPCLVDVLCEGR